MRIILLSRNIACEGDGKLLGVMMEGLRRPGFGIKCGLLTVVALILKMQGWGQDWLIRQAHRRGYGLYHSVYTAVPR